MRASIASYSMSDGTAWPDCRSVLEVRWRHTTTTWFWFGDMKSGEVGKNSSISSSIATLSKCHRIFEIAHHKWHQSPHSSRQQMQQQQPPRTSNMCIIAIQCLLRPDYTWTKNAINHRIATMCAPRTLFCGYCGYGWYFAGKHWTVEAYNMCNVQSHRAYYTHTHEWTGTVTWTREFSSSQAVELWVAAIIHTCWKVAWSVCSGGCDVLCCWAAVARVIASAIYRTSRIRWAMCRAVYYDVMFCCSFLFFICFFLFISVFCLLYCSGIVFYIVYFILCYFHSMYFYPIKLHTTSDETLSVLFRVLRFFVVLLSLSLSWYFCVACQAQHMRRAHALNI